MKRIGALLAFIIISVNSNARAQEDLSANRFLERVAAHPVGDNAETDEFGAVCQALNIAPPAEVESVLPALLRFTPGTNQARVRAFALGFLLDIAIRPDGATLLSSSSEQISSLIVDADPAIQKGAIAVTDFVIAKPATNRLPYLAALTAGLTNPKTAQNLAVTMIAPLLTYGSGDPDAMKSLLGFLHRSDLNADTRIEIVNSCSPRIPLLPPGASRYLIGELDDPNPRVRAATVIAFANPFSPFHSVALERVKKMSKDPRENKQVRELAKEALAGHAPLNPNIDMPPGDPISR